MFPYEPLDQSIDSLRVLVLLPKASKKDTGIVCELHNRTFRSKPSYEALSYTWGVQPATKTIKINGEPFLVRENLYEALQHLRLETPRILWVDAICINQDDIPERNWQVSLMAFVYIRAERVLTWLGLLPQPVQNEYFSDEHWYAMSHHPYWSRLWIIQELVLAHEVLFHMGNYTFGWDRVESTMNPEWAALKGRSDVIQKLRDERYTSTPRLETLIELFRDAQCSEKRDKIYGFLGLVYDGSDKSITIDYKLGYAQLYAQVIHFHQNTSAALDSPFPDNVDRATKLVRFSQILQSVLGGAVAQEVRNKQDTTWSTTFYHARGTIAGEVLNMGPTRSEIISSVKANKSWKVTFSKTYQRSLELQKARKAYLAFSEDMISWDEQHLERVQYIDSGTSYAYQKRSGDEPPDSLKDTKTSNAKEGKLFTGTNALIGIVPSNAQVGDLVCNFLGTDVVIIVRKVPSEDDRFAIIGRAILHRDEADHPAMDTEIEAAIEHDLSRLELGRGEATDSIPEKVINFKLDLDVLQKLTL